MPSEQNYFTLSDTAKYQVDFQQALERGDKRFVGVMGFALKVPGVPDYDEHFSQSNGVKVIEGTSDSYEDSASHARQVFCEGYAKGYNELLLHHLSSESK